MSMGRRISLCITSLPALQPSYLYDPNEAAGAANAARITENAHDQSPSDEEDEAEVYPPNKVTIMQTPSEFTSQQAASNIVLTKGEI